MDNGREANHPLPPRMTYGNDSPSAVENYLRSDLSLNEEKHNRPKDRFQFSRTTNTSHMVPEVASNGQNDNTWALLDKENRFKAQGESISGSSAWKESHNQDNKQQAGTQPDESSRRCSTNDVAGSAVSESRLAPVSRATLVRSYSRKPQKHVAMKSPVEVVTQRDHPTPVRQSAVAKADTAPAQPTARRADDNSNQDLENITRNSNTHTRISPVGEAPNTSNIYSRQQVNRSRIPSAGEALNTSNIGTRSRIPSAGEAPNTSNIGTRSRIPSAGEAPNTSNIGTRSRIPSAGEAPNSSNIGTRSRISSAGEAPNTSNIGTRSRIPSAGEAPNTSNIGTRSRIPSAGEAPNSSNIGTRSRISSAGEAPNSSNIDSRQQTTQSRKSQLDFRHISRRASQPWSTCYYHGDIVDDNLLISASKLDSTLIRLFSNLRDQSDKSQQNSGTDLMPFLNYAQSDLISMDPVMWRVYPMDAAQREALDQELPYIEENIAPKEVMTQLYQKEVLTHMDYNQLVRTEGQGDRAVNRLMVKTLQRRGHKAYPAFMEALQAHNYTLIWNRLEETERRLRSGMVAENFGSRSKQEMVNIIASQHRSPTITPLRSLAIQKANGSPLGTAVFSTNKPSSIHNDLQHISYNAASTSLVDNFLTNQLSSLDCHVTNNQPIIDSEKLEKQLRDLLTDLVALQEVVTAIKSAPSPTVSQASGTDGSTISRASPIDVESFKPNQALDSQNYSPRIRTRSMALTDIVSRPPIDEVTHTETQKSTSCVVL